MKSRNPLGAGSRSAALTCSADRVRSERPLRPDSTLFTKLVRNWFTGISTGFLRETTMRFGLPRISLRKLYLPSLSVASLRRMVKRPLHVEFVPQQLTSYSGLELLRRYLRQCELPSRLRAACAATGGDYGGGRLALLILALFYVGARRLEHRVRGPGAQRETPAGAGVSHTHCQISLQFPAPSESGRKQAQAQQDQRRGLRCLSELLRRRHDENVSHPSALHPDSK